jgi:hypothetical protein
VKAANVETEEANVEEEVAKRAKEVLLQLLLHVEKQRVANEKKVEAKRVKEKKKAEKDAEKRAVKEEEAKRAKEKKKAERDEGAQKFLRLYSDKKRITKGSGSLQKQKPLRLPSP